MLNAILSGKAGRTQETIHSGTSWSTALKQSEDLLTATIFERLSYLPASIFWEVLFRTFPDILPEFNNVKLEQIEFWPTWNDATKIRKTVEPDIYLQFSLGEPLITHHLIVEIKPGTGALQRHEQWIRQWYSFHSGILPELPDGIVSFLAIGGLNNELPSFKSTLIENATELLCEYTSEKSHLEFTPGLAGWQRLAESVRGCKKDYPELHHLLGDLDHAFAEVGFYPFEPLRTLTHIQAPNLYEGDQFE